MICPQCHAEYMSHIESCGDCDTHLVDACNIDLPIPEMSWLPLPAIEGKIYAEMATDLLDQNSIPHYVKMDWISSAYLVEATSLHGQIIKIFVPEEHLEQASSITESILGIKNETN